MTPEIFQQIPTGLYLVLAAWAFNALFNSRVVIFIFNRVLDYKKMQDDVAALKTDVSKLKNDVTAAHDKIRDLSAQPITKLSSV